MRLATSPQRDARDRSARFDRTTTFLRQRGLIRPVQRLVALVGSGSAIIAISDFAMAQPGTWITTTATVLAGILSTAVVVFWLNRWPTYWQSVCFTIAGVLVVVAWSAVQPTTTVAALACTAAAITGTYAAFFHGPRLVALNLLAALGATAYAAVRIGRQDGMHAAVTSFWVISFVTLMMPLAIGGMSRAMTGYARRSEQDPLTGLLNRRAFVEAIGHRTADARCRATFLTMVLVDIDDFKRVNDTHGHDVGDRVLRAVADLLRVHAPPTALVCRAGGEEFIVAADTSSTVDGAAIAQQLCVAIGASPHAITVSVGSVTGALAGLDASMVDAFVEDLIATADKAMYAAKRNGGNQVQHV